MSSRWPPPPDLESIKELVAQADIEGFLAKGDPADEYDTEAETIFDTVGTWSTKDLTTERVLPVIESAWAQAFGLGMPDLENRRARFRELAAQVERFFGPGATPQVRGA